MFTGDHKPTDAFGVYGDHGSWQVMFLYLDAYPAGIQAVRAVAHDKILADMHGAPIYSRAYFHYNFGGITAYHGYTPPFFEGATIGTGGCDTTCLKARRPVPAPMNAKSKGDWMVYTRADGSKQWAFQGAALYTYMPDTKPGIVNGHNVTDYIVGDEGTYKIVDGTRGDPGGGMGDTSVGLVWYVTHPDWVDR